MMARNPLGERDGTTMKTANRTGVPKGGFISDEPVIMREGKLKSERHAQTQVRRRRHCSNIRGLDSSHRRRTTGAVSPTVLCVTQIALQGELLVCEAAQVWYARLLSCPRVATQPSL